MGRQRRQIWFKRPRVNPTPAGMEQNEGLTCALLVVPGTNSIQLNIACHKDSFPVALPSSLHLIDTKGRFMANYVELIGIRTVYDELNTGEHLIVLHPGGGGGDSRES